MVKVSVVVPIYNVKKYIDKEVKSILEQTMSDWEMILVDDGSTDDVRDLLESYVSEDNRIRVIYHENNQGVAGARKTGWLHAKGEYVCFFDADDWVEPNTLEALYTTATENDADIVCFSYIEEYESKSIRFGFGEKEDKVYTGEEAILELHRRKNIQPHAWNKLYKRSLFEEKMFAEEKALGEDYGMLVELFWNNPKIIQTNTPYYHYVLRKGSSLDVGFGSFYRNGFFFYERYEKELISRYPQYQKDIQRYHLIEQMAIVVSMFKNNEYDHEIRKNVTSHIRKNLWLLLSGKDVAFEFKISAIALCIHYKILKSGYRIIYRKRRKQRKEIV